MFVRIIPLVLSFLILSAHFLRHGNYPLMIGCLMAPFLLVVKKRWVLVLTQVLIFLAAVIWIRAAIFLYHHRVAMGQPWGRMVIILGVVALLTAISGWLLNSPKVKEKYL